MRIRTWPVIPMLALAMAGCATRAPAPSDDPAVPAASVPPQPRARAPVDRPATAPSATPTPLPPPSRVESGIASWYGPGFHGRTTASGETYNMHALTAAHRKMPIPSYARIVNPANGRSVVVRINDRGPFAKGRIVDLSYAAAVALDTQDGVAPVQVVPLASDELAGVAARAIIGADDADDDLAVAPAESRTPIVAGERAPTAAGRGFWVEIATFRELEAAWRLQRQASRSEPQLAPLLAVFSSKGRKRHRVQAGPFASPRSAGRVAARLQGRLALAPTIVERR